jgi:hypothetical protein
VKEKIQTLEKQVTELRSSMLSKDHVSQQREQAYNELWGLLASSTLLKTDKALV